MEQVHVVTYTGTCAIFNLFFGVQILEQITRVYFLWKLAEFYFILTVSQLAIPGVSYVCLNVSLNLCLEKLHFRWPCRVICKQRQELQIDDVFLDT